ncbi:MAG: ATP-binding protein [Candidatus Thiodiazotropha lotti]|nr:ATP-binding protein [Candidatus Thiodiazotropha lotti]MCW4221779.1 ATP-binding protein [Candidatus Thiodiazotropha lotti]
MKTSAEKHTPEPQQKKSHGCDDGLDDRLKRVMERTKVVRTEKQEAIAPEIDEVEAVCEQHGKYTAKRVLIIGNKYRTTQCPECEKEAAALREREEKARRAAERKRRIEGKIKQSLIPERYKGRSLENYRAGNGGQELALAVARKYATDFKERLAQGGGLVFCGLPGTGKTHLATAIANHVLRDGYTALFMTVLRAVRTVKETYRRDSDRTELEAINELSDPDLLILDEVGVQFGTEAEKMILFEIINTRYESMKPTIIVSNLSETELSEYIGVRVVDRLREGGGAVVAFTWDSYRGKVVTDEDLPAREIKPSESRVGMPESVDEVIKRQNL